MKALLGLIFLSPLFGFGQVAQLYYQDDFGKPGWRVVYPEPPEVNRQEEVKNATLFIEAYNILYKDGWRIVGRCDSKYTKYCHILEFKKESK